MSSTLGALLPQLRKVPGTPKLLDGVLAQEDEPRCDLFTWFCYHCGRKSDWPKGNDEGGLRVHLRKMHGITNPTISRITNVLDGKAARRRHAEAIAAELAELLAEPEPSSHSCPNCGSALSYIRANDRWRSHWTCAECTRAFHLVPYTMRGQQQRYELEQGRELR